MAYSNKMGPPIVAAAVATIGLTSFTIVMIVKASSTLLFNAVWPIVLTSAVAVVLVMSFLYRSLVDLVSGLEQQERLCRHQALHDELTGLGNRRLLEQRLDTILPQVRRGDLSAALLVLDLDRFKEVNDTLGHASGDALVTQVGARLSQLLRETDTVARIGGDEFAIIQCGAKGPAEVRRLCNRIIEAISEPFALPGRNARVGVSIGAVLADAGSNNGQELIRKADITMYRAKAAGRNCFRIFSDAMDAAVRRRTMLEDGLRAALEEAAPIELHYQPQIDPSGRINGAEALLRWTHPELGPVPPAELVPIAEQAGLIDALGEAVFRTACLAARKWPTLSVAVNVSPLQFRQIALAERLAAIAAEEGVGCKQIELEITEGLFLEHAECAEATIKALRQHGFRIALDDFGTGYSSLSYLKRFKVDKVKLDRSFMDGVDEPEVAAVVRGAVLLGQAMGLDVVAEGIATEHHERIAIGSGCNGLQGYRYAPALPLDSLADLIGHPGKTQFAIAA